MDSLDLSTLPPERLPLALADAHRGHDVGALMTVGFGSGISPEFERDLLEGAGLVRRRSGVERLRTLPDTVGAGMTLLICGLNPSLHAADMGIGFGRSGNRFWPAALDAGLVSTDRDPRLALTDHGVGMTDLVKRATRRADQLSAAEYQRGLERVERLVSWLNPAAVCFVGLAGWRAAVDRKAVRGPQDRRVGGRPAYVMPSTSGLNARTTRDELASHLRQAAALAR